MKKNDYYTYLGIVLGLRKEYQKNVELLKNLEQLISIEKDKGYEKRLYISLKDLFLSVYKKQSEIKRYYDEFVHGYNKSKGKIIGKFQLQEKNGVFEFRQRYLSDSISLEIINQNGFKELYEELKKSQLFNTQGVLTNLNYFQIFSIDANEINLNTNIGLSDEKYIKIQYNSETDDILIKRNFINSIDEYTAHGLLDTPIPRYIIPKGYLDILDNTKDSEKTAFFDLEWFDVPNGNYIITDSKRLVKR